MYLTSLTRKLYLMKFTSRPQAVHPKVMTNAMASYKGRFQKQDYKALSSVFCIEGNEDNEDH